MSVITVHERKSNIISPLPDFEPEIGRWLWGMDDVRRTIKTKLADISQEMLDFKPEGKSSIGSLLYHIALIEADWLYEEVLCSPWDPAIKALFPAECRDESDGLSSVEGEDAISHFARLDQVRETFKANFRGMSLEEWRRPRVLPAYDVTPEWVVYHLIEHEANHRGQIFTIYNQLNSQL
ncbi:putative damage-inducible protein DinB [Fontibacillus phaseoli]|uniref:Putative damage-inducible protein DinB n=1 Tax=Fontibacillus phaseoli TaxID=1416533 RepID=A0A369BQC9_9BACL|nr:DinB family protein [Fontibacillus phaseoli]RCX23832.1 putative damage-inducible protein DinB [Fontibacillus phaseoli]